MAFDQNGFELADAPITGVDENGFELAESTPFRPQSLLGESARQLPDLQATTRGGSPLHVNFDTDWQGPSRMIANEIGTGDPNESLLGIRPAGVPTGEEITKATGIPKAITIPISGAGKAIAGLGQFLTSPSGLEQSVAASIPGVGLLQRARWIYDMAKGTGESAGSLYERIKKIATSPDKTTTEEWQGLAEDTASAALMLYGAGKLSSHEVAQLTGIRAPIGRAFESEKTRLSKDVAREIDQSPVAAETIPITQPQILPDPRGEPIPGVAENADLMNQALAESQQRVIRPGQVPAIDLLKRQREDQIVPAGAAEPMVFDGGGEAPFGKVSYMRQAEAPLTEGAQQALRQLPPKELSNSGVTAPPEPPLPAAAPAPTTNPTEISSKLVVAPPGPEVVAPEVKPAQPSPVLAGEKVKPPTVKQAFDKLALDYAIETGIPYNEILLSDVKDLHPGAKSTHNAELQRLRRVMLSEVDLKGADSRLKSNLEKAMPLLQAKLDQHRAAQAVKLKSGQNQGEFPAEDLTLMGQSGIDAERVAAEKAQREADLKAEDEFHRKNQPDLFADTIKNIEDLQKQIRGTGENLGLNVPKAILDTALEVARLTLKAGKSVAEAVDAAIAHIRKNASFEVKSKFNEAKARETLMASLSPKATTDPSPKTTTAPARTLDGVDLMGAGVMPKGAKIVNQALEDIFKRFEPVKKPRPAIGRMASKVAESVRTGVISKFRPIDKLADDIAKEYGTRTPKKIAGVFEAIKGSSGKAEADIYRFDQDVSKPLRGNERNFNAYMLLKRSLDRLNQDVAEGTTRRGVSSYTIPELQSKLATLEAELGPERTTAFKDVADKYQQHLDEALRLQVESGRMSPAIYAEIKNGNQFYAPFKVMKYLEESSRPEGTGRRVDTLAEFTKAMKGITDKDFRLGDMLGAARQNIMFSRILAEKNRAMLNISRLAGYDTSGKFIQKLKSGQEAPKDMTAVNVLEGGQQVRYAVNNDVAQAVQIYGQQGQNILVQMMGAAAVPFRAGATALNIPFQVSNLLADVPRAALVSKYGIRGATDLVRYPLDFVQSLYSSMAGDMLGAKNKLFLDFLDSGVAGSTVQETLMPKSLSQKPYSAARTAGRNILWAIPDFAKAIEQTSKIMGVKRAMRFEGAKSGKELAKRVPEAITEIRRFSGSPDFGRQGKWVEQARLNIIYMFLNARLQGATADVGRLIGRDSSGTAAKTWLKLGAAIGIPTAYVYLLNQSKEYADDYDKRPDQEKKNYWLIPKDTFITASDGTKVRDYWRIPKRESSKWIANMVESGLEFARQKDPASLGRFAMNMMEDISPVNLQGKNFQERLESTATSLNPLIKAPIELASGRDMYRHRDIIPDQMKKASPEQQYTDRTAEVFKSLAKAMPEVAPEVFRSPLMMENLTKNMTAGLITQFLPRKPVEGRSRIENSPLLQRFQGLPVVDREKFDREMAAMERDAADEQLTRHRTALKLLEENKGKDIKEIARASVNQFGQQPKLIRHLVDLWVAEKRGITGEEKQLLSLPAQQRAAYILARIKGVTPEVKHQILEGFASKRILTESVAAEMKQQMQP